MQNALKAVVTESQTHCPARRLGCRERRRWQDLGRRGQAQPPATHASLTRSKAGEGVLQPVQKQWFMRVEGHNHCFMHFLASKHSLGTFFAPPLTKLGYGVRQPLEFDDAASSSSSSSDEEGIGELRTLSWKHSERSGG